MKDAFRADMTRSGCGFSTSTVRSCERDRSSLFLNVVSERQDEGLDGNRVSVMNSAWNFGLYPCPLMSLT